LISKVKRKFTDAVRAVIPTIWSTLRRAFTAWCAIGPTCWDKIFFEFSKHNEGGNMCTKEPTAIDGSSEPEALDGGIRQSWVSSISGIWKVLATFLGQDEPWTRSTAEILSSTGRNKREYDALRYGHYIPPAF
jgi:hypothetical protein